MNNILKTETCDLAQYVVLLEYDIGTESMPAISSLPGYFVGAIGGAKNMFSGVLESFSFVDKKKANMQYLEMLKSKRKLDKSLDSIDYARVKRRNVPVGIGLTGNIMDMATRLDQLISIVNNNLDKFLDEPPKVLARLATDEDYRNSFLPSKDMKHYIKVNSELEDGLSDLIDPHNIKDVVSVDKLLPSVQHLVEAMSYASKYGNHVTLERMEAMKEKLDDVVAYTAELHRLVKSGKVRFSKERITELTNYIEVIANFCMLSNKVYYLANKSIIIMDNAVKIILK